MVPEPTPAEPLDRDLREAVFSMLDPRWIVHEDADLIAIDKPPFVPTQEAREGDADDLPARVRGFLARRDGSRAPYVGVHQRLDRDTSGVVLYTKRPEANARLAAQMEARAVEKVYVAVVDTWRGGRTTLRHRLAPGSDGTMRVGAQGKPAVTHVRPLARSGRHTLLELRIETGRTHQIRAQLAHTGAPVCGDVLYGGSPAPRLFLHALSLTLDHPVDGRRLACTAPVPAAFDAWMKGRREPLAQSLAAAVQRRFALGCAGLRPAQDATTAFRLVHGEADGWPGAAVDLYADWAVLHLYDDAPGLEEEAADALVACGLTGVYVKRRPRQANVVTEHAALAPAEPIRGRPAPTSLLVREHGLPFAVRLGDGLSTGLFLDQRDNRRRVRQRSGGASVLNLFSYTCGFTVAAVAGGAARTVSVDASGAALDRGRLNLDGLGAGTTEAHRFVRADAFEWLARAGRRGETFDVVCCDPPTYATGSQGRWTSGAAWASLTAMCVKVLAPGGTLLVTSNDRRMTRAAFRAFVRRGAADAGRAWTSLKDLPMPPDFPSLSGQEPHTKGLLGCAP